MSVREQLRALVERLPDDQVEEALRVLESMQSSGPVDPMLRMLLQAPEDDEPLSQAEVEAVEAAIAEADRGELIPLEEVRKQLG